MNLSNSQFGQLVGHKSSELEQASKPRSMNPLVSQFLSLAIKQERLKKLQNQNKEINERLLRTD